MARLRAEGVSEDGLEHAICVAAFFNYFPRVADGVGIEFDYASSLPRLTIDPAREALPRPEPSTWSPDVDGSTVPVFPRRPYGQAAIEHWRAFMLDRDAPLSVRDRRVLVRAVSEQLCDAGACARYADATPQDAREGALAAYATKLTLTPWAMSTADLAPSRDEGLSDPAILDMITVVAHQNTISRMHFGLAAMRG